MACQFANQSHDPNSNSQSSKDEMASDEPAMQIAVLLTVSLSKLDRCNQFVECCC